MPEAQNHGLVIVIQDKDGNVLECIQLNKYELESSIDDRLQLTADFLKAVKAAVLNSNKVPTTD